ncbi:MAG: tetratricopeptide repeat protein, partial [Hyphomicrobiales bacterium]|nr:tetratricopeptide repeat protein [Hyphomicrobiales bacterium]
MTTGLTIADALARAERCLGASRLEPAVQLCRQVLQADAENPHALHILAIVANRSGKPDRALEIVERALQSRPDDPAINNSFGLILSRLGRFEAAEAAFRRSLASEPGQKQPMLNLAALMERRNQFAQALDLLSEINRQFGAAPDTSSLRAVVLQSEGSFDAALDVLDRAVQNAPEDVDIRFARANLLLLLGRTEAGWPDFELRRNRRLGRAPPVDRPPWSGAVTPGERVLLYAEHGLGDTIQFARYAPYLRDRGVDVTFACYSSLLPLMQSLGLGDRLVADDGPIPECDAVAPLMSLPRLLGQGIPEIAALGKSVPYLHSDRAETGSLKQALDRIPGLKVGLAWQGNPNQSTDADRSIPIASFEPLFGVAGVTIVSLQIGPGADGIDVFKDSHRVVDWPEAKAGLGNTA